MDRDEMAKIIAPVVGEMRSYAVINAFAAAGLVLAPREPTQRMIEDGWAAAHEEDALNTWRDMMASWFGETDGSRA